MPLCTPANQSDGQFGGQYRRDYTDPIALNGSFTNNPSSSQNPPPGTSNAPLAPNPSGGTAAPHTTSFSAPEQTAKQLQSPNDFLHIGAWASECLK